MATPEHSLNAAMGRVLAGFRGELGMNQKEFGMLLGGLGQRTVSAMEAGGRPIHAAEIVLFGAALSTALPYTSEEIKERFFDSRRLSPVGTGDGASLVDSHPSDSETGGSLKAA
jgi:hypothetical protein